MADYATLLRDHVTLKCRSIDRIFLQAYVPKLQAVGQVCTFLRWCRNFPIPSSAAFGQIGRAYEKEVNAFAKRNKVQVIRFEKGQNKEDLAKSYIDAAAREGGTGRVALIGIAQEKASAWRSWPAKGQEKSAHPHMEWGRQMTFINHFYFYLWDPEWGGAFWKTNAYAPFPIWIWLNGHEWAKRQLEKAGVAYEALDNGFRSCDDPTVLQSVCDRLGAREVREFFQRWLDRLPSPFTVKERQTGYGYDLAFRQFEVSDTVVFDRPATGRAWFESVIPDLQSPSNREDTRHVPHARHHRWRRSHPHLLLQVIATQAVLQGGSRPANRDRHLRHTRLRSRPSRLRPKLEVGEGANQRLCAAEAADALPAPDAATFRKVTLPSTTEDGQYVSGLRFADPRVMALFAALVGFSFLVNGFSNRQIVARTAALLDSIYTTRHATYDLRRLRRKGIVARIPKTHRYQLTPEGRAIAVLFTKAYGRVLAPGLSLLDPRLPDDLIKRRPIATSWRHFNRDLDAFLISAMTAA
jgi:hypothetical protein